ncbi:amino acid ABC transporter permease [Endozoicomonas sp. SM1973]|uniref:Amino acid ABC transporter permease n=1 Tax=Spartinivicinus marinus TaxID=2994442 RepID=A0A853HVB8_9GAMM|nr:amino acid ABC transporter permease [Spartinivicinus marinus]MCX4025707.1 amino acid ABC transporter permease [Spartinivicinus marinus]NYZ65700.1 amino acid ABC transporter permease [Spartinivicinus marinus]
MPENKHNLATGNVSFWNDPAKRSLVFQAILFLAVFAVGYIIYQNTQHNLESRGITTGFEFLDAEAGFGIIQSLIPYDETHSYGRTFVVGLLNTILVAALGIFFATILGFLIGVARLSHNWLIARIAAVYIEIFRNIPLLLQIFFWYFAVLRLLPGPRQSLELANVAFLNVRGVYLPSPVLGEGFSWVLAALVLALIVIFFIKRWARRRQSETGDQFPVFWASLGVLIGLPFIVFLLSGASLQWEIPELKGFNFRGGLTIIPELSALLIALTIYTAAFIAEIVRSGIESISKGQTEAARALGVSPGKTLQLVIIPQAMRVIIPPLTSQYLNLIKNSSLATAIGYPDLVSVFAGTTLNQTGQAIEVISMTMAVYLTLSLLVSLFMNWYNKRMALVER